MKPNIKAIKISTQLLNLKPKNIVIETSSFYGSLLGFVWEFEKEEKERLWREKNIWEN